MLIQNYTNIHKHAPWKKRQTREKYTVYSKYGGLDDIMIAAVDKTIAAVRRTIAAEYVSIAVMDVSV